MKLANKRTALFLALLIAVSVALSGCYVEPDIIQSGNESTFGNNVPYYPTYSTNAPATQVPTGTPYLVITPTPARIVMLPGSSGMTAAPQQQNTGDEGNSGAMVIMPTSNSTPIPVTNTPRPTATPTPTSSVLRFGLKNSAAVRDLQKKLKNLGFYSGNIDGDYGASTKTAVTNFQRAYGLTADGVAGEKTLQTLNTAKMTARPTASPTPKPTATPRIGKNILLQRGSNNDATMTMQRRLISLGYLNGKATGKFEEITEQAVIAFQSRNMDTADGIAGSETLNVMYSQNAKKAATSSGIIGISLKESAQDTEAVKTLQRKLKALGYFTGTVDGDFGANTTVAVKEFQAQNGLKADGVAGGRTLTLLFTGTPKRFDPSKASVGTNTPRPGITASGATNPPKFTTVTNSPNGYATLHMGDAGAPVRKLQTALKNAKYYTGKIDGQYGASTYDAVRAFQKANGIKVDGVAGLATLDRLYGIVATATPTAKAGTGTNPPVYRTVTNPPVGSNYITLRMGDSGAPVTQLQNALKKAKYFTGKVDGKYGQSTYDAVIAFQKANGLKQTGVANLATNKLLFGLAPTASPTPKTVTNPPKYRTVTNPPVGSDYITLRMGDSGAPVTQLQQALKKGGYFKGTVDGKYGGTTYQAIKNFQANNGLKQDGIANKTTQRLLYGGKYNRTPTPSPKATTPTPRRTATPRVTERNGRTTATPRRTATPRVTERKGRETATPRRTATPRVTERKGRTTATPRRTATPNRRTATPKVTNPANFRTVTAAPAGKYPVLELGSKGDPVKTLQTALRKLGYFKGNSDGKYGTTTYQAVMAFQADYGLKQDGIAGATVQKRIYQAEPTAAPTRTPRPTKTPRASATPNYAKTNPPDYRTVTESPKGDYIVLKIGDSGKPVEKLQTELKKQGYYKYTVTGNFGVNTHNAIVKYQMDHGLRTTGIADKATQRNLYEGDYPDES